MTDTEIRKDAARIYSELRTVPGYAFPPGLDPSLESDTKWQTEALTYSNTSHVAEVEVDIELASVKVTRYIALQDVGVTPGPIGVDGLVGLDEGGVDLEQVGGQVLAYPCHQAGLDPRAELLRQDGHEPRPDARHLPAVHDDSAHGEHDGERGGDANCPRASGESH